MTDTLELLRSKIDDINSEILELVNQRVAISLQIADIKQQKDIPLFDADREKFIANQGTVGTWMLYSGICGGYEEHWF